MTTERIQELKNNYHFGQYYNQFYAAHNWTSFSPDKRAEQNIIEFSNWLEDDLKILGEHPGNYKEKFTEHILKWMNSKSNCASSMITGPANFNVRKKEKANNRERANYEKFSHWRTKYFEAVNRIPTKSPEQELEEAERELNKYSNLQEELKEINKVLRKHKEKTLNEAIEILTKEEYSEESIKLVSYYSGTIPGYALTNRNAKINRLKDKVIVMLSRIERKDNWEDIKFNGGYVTIEDDRVKIFHETKPEADIITELKKNGFRWSPNWKCWCRKHTGNAISVTKNLSFVN